MKNLQSFLFLLLIFFIVLKSEAQVSTIISLGNDGRLVYQPDSKGNTVPDFSGVGYMNGESPIPNVPVVRTVDPVAGDNLANIQNAINYAASLPADANGIRGAILFRSGNYNVSDTVKITADGIVLRGEGTDLATGTNFIATKTAQHAFICFIGAQKYSKSNSSKKAIVNPYLPYGSKKITVASGHTFQTGNTILVHVMPNQLWIKKLHMDSLSFIDPGTPGIINWDAANFDIYYERKVTAVSGDTITIDAPMTDLIDTTYAKGEVLKYTERRMQNCGIENIRLTSYYASETDNNHGWDAVSFTNSVNGWAKNVDVYYFGFSAVHIEDGSSWITVQDCKMIDGKSTLAGGERYSFNIDGQRSLVRDCFTRNGRHDFVTGSKTGGPNVFYNCTATLQQADIGPHLKWATGVLFDNITGDGFFAVQNRTNSGSGHGWAGAETMFWNCTGQRLVLQDPQGDNTNWAIGCDNWITGAGDLGTWPLGIIESEGTHITAIPSLFLAQLNERLNSTLPLKFVKITAVKNNAVVDVHWSTSNEINNDRFVIQCSNNGVDFFDIGIVYSNCHNGQSCEYQFRHLTPFNGNNFYRVKQIDKDGKSALSAIAKLIFSKNTFSIKSNIVKNSIEIFCDGNNKEEINIYNTDGSLVLKKMISGSALLDISLLPCGLYFIKNMDGEILKFIKLY